MLVFHRSFRRSVFTLLCTVSAACAAQNSQQFYNLPLPELTGGQVASFLTGTFQTPPTYPDILFVNAPTGSGTNMSVTAGAMVNSAGSGFLSSSENRIVFTGVSNVVAASAYFDSDPKADFAFALTPTVAGGPNLCVYYGTGATYQQVPNGASSFDGATGVPNEYPPTGGKNGCMTFPTSGSKPPNFTQIVPFLFKATSAISNLLIEDSANNLIYVLKSQGTSGINGQLTGFSPVGPPIQLAAADGAGPIYVGDFNGDGFTDFIVNGQTGHSATVYFGDGTGNFTPQPPYHFDRNVHSMLLQDMDGDGRPDMVVEGDNGIIEIFHGNPDGSFAAASEGGTLPGLNGLSGNGGQLAAINPSTLDILTATPIGLSVLQRQPSTLNYALKSIYNIGPGRSTYTLTDFFGTSMFDLAVNSAEGVVIFRADGNGDGGFQTSYAYPALVPALGATVGKFRNGANNPNGLQDVVVATGAVQGQLLTGSGTGAVFAPSATPTDTNPPANVPANLWSNIVSGDFNGDGKLDIAYTLTGLPLPSPGSGAGPGVYVQYGNGNGTFQAPVAITSTSGNDPLYGESTIGDFNGDGIADIANIGGSYDYTLLGQGSGVFKPGLALFEINPNFNQVAAGFFKAGRLSQQDLIFQQETNFSGSSYMAVFIPYKNLLDGTGKNFTAMPALTNGAQPPLYPSTVLLADVDGDGNGDVVALYYNTNPNPVGAGPVSPNQLYIWYGNGDGTFSATPQVINLSRNDYLGLVADMNGDGLPDLVLSDGSLISILYNQGATATPFNRTFGGEQHFLAGQGINSLSLLNLAGNSLPGLVVANGGATVSNPIVLGEDTASSVALPPNPDVNTGGITVLVNDISTTPVTGTLAATPEPSLYSATFTLTATITPVIGTTVPQGVVTFSIDGVAAPCSPDSLTPVGGTSLSAVATCIIPAGNNYASGTHSISAAYSGSSVYTEATLAGTHTIGGGTTTTTIYLCVGPAPNCPSTGFVFPPFSAALTMYYGQTWNGTWQISESDTSPLTGDFELFDTYNGVSGPAICTVPSSGTACPPAVGLTIGTGVGTNVLTGAYTGDSTHTGSTSSPVTITVLQDTTGSAALTGSPDPSPADQPVTFTATLAGNFAAPIGTVTFSQVNPGGATTTLGTATFTPGSGFTSTATFTTSSLPLGSDTIAASYAGTTDFAAATFPTFVETITPSLSGTFALAVTPNPATTGVGIGAVLTVTVTPQNGFAQGVNLTCSNLPSEATCTFTNSAIAAGGGSTYLVVQTTPPHTCGTNTPYFYGRTGRGPLAAPVVLPGLAGLLLLVVPGKRRLLRSLVVVAGVACIAQISGCSTNCTDLGTRPATYTFQVTGTASSSPTTTSQSVTLTVTI